MFIDKQLEFSDAQTIAAAASTNTIDLGPMKGTSRGVEAGEHTSIMLATPTAIVGGGTVTVAVQTDDNEAFSSATTLMTSKAYSAADFAAGPIFLPFPPGAERYVRLSYTTGGTVSAGTIDAALVLDKSAPRNYPRNYTL